MSFRRLQSHDEMNGLSPQQLVSAFNEVPRGREMADLDLIILTFAQAIDSTNPMNQVRIPLYEALARALRGRGKILVVPRWISFVPDVLTDQKSFFNRIIRSAVRQDAENLFVYTPIVPVKPAALAFSPFLLHHELKLIAGQLKRVMKSLDFKASYRVLSVNHPFHWRFIGLLDESISVYDCLDEYSLYGGVSEPNATMLGQERELAKRTDLVFTTSKELFDKMVVQKTNTFYSPNAVDFDFFHRASFPATPVAPILESISRPIIGFMGALCHWYDFRLLHQVISLRPSWSFVFIGWVLPQAVEKEIEALKDLPNAFFLGVQEFDALPSFLKGFDAAIMPYKVDRVGRSVNPDKMYQYMAAGVPVVATPTPEIAQYNEIIDVAENPADFIAALERRLATGREDRRVTKGIDTARQNTWENRVEAQIHIIQAALARKPLPGVGPSAEGLARDT